MFPSYGAMARHPPSLASMFPSYGAMARHPPSLA
jgi:hypothetical protein